MLMKKREKEREEGRREEGRYFEYLSSAQH